jgi:hypothetical protein
MSRARIFHLYGDVTIIGEGLQNLGLYARRSKPLIRGGDLYRATPAVPLGLGFADLIRKTAPFSRLLRFAWDTDDLFKPDPHGSPFSRLLQCTSRKRMLRTSSNLDPPGYHLSMPNSNASKQQQKKLVQTTMVFHTFFF